MFPCFPHVSHVSQHIHFVEGNGKNGYSSGQIGVLVDENYQSGSKDFSGLQIAANNHNDLVKLEIVGQGESFQMMSYSIEGGKRVRGTANVPVTSPTDPANGFTFFPFTGKYEEGVLYSTGPFTMIFANGMLDGTELTATIYHELRHVLLGDFGRMVDAAKHSKTFNFDNVPKNNADQQTLEAEQEARKNAQQ